MNHIGPSAMLLERLETAKMVMAKNKWMDEARAIDEAISRIIQFEEMCMGIILTVDFASRKITDKLDVIADEVQITLYCLPGEDDEENEGKE